MHYHEYKTLDCCRYKGREEATLNPRLTEATKLEQYVRLHFVYDLQQSFQKVSHP